MPDEPANPQDAPARPAEPKPETKRAPFLPDDKGAHIARHGLKTK